MRKRISEVNIFPQFDMYQEYRKIEYLLSENKIIGTYDRWGDRKIPYHTLEDYIDQLQFTNWNLRGTFLSIQDMRSGLGIDKRVLTKESLDEETLLDFLQYAFNIILRFDLTKRNCSQIYIADEKYTDMMIKNIKEFLSQLKATFEIDKENMEISIVYDDDLSSIVAEEMPEIESSLIEYKKIDNRGDLQRKGEILCTLFKKLEPIEKSFKGSAFASLASDTTFLFNKIGARHWVEKDRIASATFMKMESEELEEWYDRTYTLFLSCMVASGYLDIKKDIDNIKRVE